MRVTRHHSCRVSPFGHPRINARLAAPRGLSQPPTSFIGSQCQGIHHAPLNTYKHKTNIRNCTSANNNQHPHTPPERETRRRHGHCSLDARNHYPRIKHHTPHHQRWSDNNPPPQGRTGLVVSKPNSVFSDSFTDKNPAPAKRLLCTQPATHYRRRRSSPNHRFPQVWGRGNNTGAP